MAPKRLILCLIPSHVSLNLYFKVRNITFKAPSRMLNLYLKFHLRVSKGKRLVCVFRRKKYFTSFLWLSVFINLCSGAGEVAQGQSAGYANMMTCVWIHKTHLKARKPWQPPAILAQVISGSSYLAGVGRISKLSFTKRL